MLRSHLGCKLYFRSPLNASDSSITGIEEDDLGMDRLQDSFLENDPCFQEMERLRTRLEKLKRDVKVLRNGTQDLYHDFGKLNTSANRALKHLTEVHVKVEELEDSRKQAEYLDKLLDFLKRSGLRIRLVPFVLRCGNKHREEPGATPV